MSDDCKTNEIVCNHCKWPHTYEINVENPKLNQIKYGVKIITLKSLENVPSSSVEHALTISAYLTPPQTIMHGVEQKGRGTNKKGKPHELACHTYRTNQMKRKRNQFGS